MKKWVDAEIEAISFEETMHGGSSELEHDSYWTDDGRHLGSRGSQAPIPS